MLNTINMIIIQIVAVAADLGLQFHGDSWKQTLPAMVIGMLGIFLVIGVIILATYLLNKAFSRKKDDEE